MSLISAHSYSTSTDEEYDEIDVSQDPTLSKYPNPKDTEWIVDRYFCKDPKKKKTFDQVQHQYNRLTSAKEIHRCVLFLNR